MKKYQRKLALAVAAGLLVTGTISVSASGIRDVFDAKYYADTYQDLMSTFGYDEEALYQHFLTYGISEGRTMSPIFDIQAYRAAYADLDAAFGENWDAYVDHYLAYGANEGRTEGILFDPAAYAKAYPDVAAAFGDDYGAIVEHYLTYGIAEGRTEGVIVTAAPAPAVNTAPVENTQTSSAGSSSGEDSGTTTTTEGFTVKKTLYAAVSGGERVQVTADNADTYFDVSGTTISLKENVAIFEGAAGTKITSSEGYARGTAAALDYQSGKSIAVAAEVTDLTSCFKIESNSVELNEGINVIGCASSTYAVISDSNIDTYVEIENDAVKLKTDVKVYTTSAVAKTDLPNYFTIGAGNSLSLKGSAVLLAETIVVDASNAATYVKVTPASVALGSTKLYSDADSKTEITDATTIFDVAPDGTVTLKNGADVYTAGGKEINAAQIGDYLTYTPAATPEPEE